MTPPLKALVIDDEIQLRRLLRMTLQDRGYEVFEAENGTLGISEALYRRPDVILLDMGLPDMDGIEVLKRLREWNNVPVLILSVRDHESVKVSALENGADDYVTKPFSTPELLARLSALQRRRKNDEEPVLRIGKLEFDFAQHEARLEGEVLKLTPIEYRLLALLMKHAGKIVMQKHVLQEVWGPQAEEQSQYLRVYVTHLRKKLREDETGIKIINEPGIGYRLIER